MAIAPSSLLTVISSGLGGGCLLRACFLEASSSGDKVAVGLALPLGVPVTVGMLLVLGVALGVLALAVATAALALAVFEAFCSWLSLHPANPEQASRLKANAA